MMNNVRMSVTSIRDYCHLPHAVKFRSIYTQFRFQRRISSEDDQTYGEVDNVAILASN